MMSLEHQLIWVQRQDYLRQAEHHRLLKLVSTDRPGPASKLMAWTGRRLVAVGERLQSHATAAAPVVAYSDGHF